jgi:dihydrofolate synthase/folylpolyglutamate synthase
MIAAILTAAGYKVGLYTSPHLVKFNERIRINGKMISDVDIARYVRKLKPQIHRLNSTFFETTTAIAFKYFADQKVDFAVIETGLGGRLDSTNVIKPIVSVITSIGKDHTEQLGNTVTAIAGEKAGIIKSKTPLIIGNISNAANRIISRRANEKNAQVILAKKIPLPPNIQLQLNGKHQIINAKTAVAAISVVCRNFLIGNDALRIGLEQTSRLTGLRARFEMIKGKPDILLDVAHNPDGINALVTELKKYSYKKFVVVFAVMRDKEYRSMIVNLKKLQPVMIATAPAIERALPAKQLYEIMQKKEINAYCETEISKALSRGKKLASPNGLLIITGSHYLVGEAIQSLEN